MNSPHRWEWWLGPWRSLIHCTCGALTHVGHECPVCQKNWRSEEHEVEDAAVSLRSVPAAFAGAITWSDFVMLKLMHVEWQRPDGHSDTLAGIPGDRRPSPRVVLVVLFWSFFESLMQRFFEAAMREIPERVAEDLLRRYSGIGARLDRLYSMLFDAKFSDDLAYIGYGDLYAHLSEIQRRRNAFIHGEPEAITDQIVRATVERLPEFKEAWVALYNLRCARRGARTTAT